MRLSTDAIVVSNDAYPLDEQNIRNLMGSIQKVGLLNPITVNQNNRLVSGHHRLEACKRLGHREIEVTQKQLNDLEFELARIVENEHRSSRPALEVAESYSKLKDAYEKLYPETKHGACGGGKKGRGTRSRTENDSLSFSVFVSQQINLSPRTVERLIGIARRLAPDVRDKLHGTPLADAKFELMRLAKHSPEVQRDCVERYLGSPILSPTIRQFLPPVEKRIDLRASRLRRAPEITKQDPVAFLQELEDESVQMLFALAPPTDELRVDQWLPLALAKLRKRGYAYIAINPDPAELHAYLDFFDSCEQFFVANILVWTQRKPADKDTFHDYHRDWWGVLFVRSADSRGLDRQGPADCGSVFSDSPDDFARKIVRHGAHCGELVIVPFAKDAMFVLEAAGDYGCVARGCDTSAHRE
ncbi:MAG: ParB N-terminal domain-containing protein [Deltaproteobacteria bacterium]|nr:ParB N-terminal domain-containing protein [Deltaproteobacteria bacterium]